MENFTMQFTLDVVNDSLQTPVDLLALSDLLQKDFPDYDQFILESMGGPKIDTKQSVLGLGTLLCVEVKDNHVILNGNATLIKIIDKYLSGMNLEKINSSSTIDIIRAIENCATVMWPDGSSGKLPLLTIIGYDAVAPRAAAYGQVFMPDLVIIVPLIIIRIDHWNKRFTVMSLDMSESFSKIQSSIHSFLINSKHTWNNATLAKNIPVNLTVSPHQYMKNMMECKEHILAGDIYQIQLGHEVLVHTNESSISIYKRLRQLNPSPYMFFVHLPSVTLVGASPELFIRIDAGNIQMRPLAGTLPKTAISTSHELRGNPKEQAEHIMLVDLCRNDIGRVAKIGTVKVPQLVYAEEYSTVFHLVSTITGMLQDELDVWDVIKACSPAGTMTGTPKIRAATIIAEHEWTRRGLYAGSIAFSDGLGNLVSALIIRTLIINNGLVSVRASAGIVADSEPEKEWLETLAKIRSSMAAVTSNELPIKL
jgi:anthranilate synthase component 1